MELFRHQLAAVNELLEAGREQRWTSRRFDWLGDGWVPGKHRAETPAFDETMDAFDWHPLHTLVVSFEKPAPLSRQTLEALGLKHGFTVED